MMPNSYNNYNNQTRIFTMFVQGEDLPNTYPVPLGTTGIFIDFSSKHFWVRENPSGVPMPLRMFTFDEVITNPTPQNGSGSGVSREEFNALSSKLDKLLAELGGVKS